MDQTKWVIFCNDIHHCEHNFASSGFTLVNYTGCKTRVRVPCGHVWMVTGKSRKTRNLTEKYIFRRDTMKPGDTVTDMFKSCQNKKNKLRWIFFLDKWHLRDAVVTTWDAKVIAQSLRQIDVDLSLRIFQTITTHTTLVTHQSSSFTESSSIRFFIYWLFIWLAKSYLQLFVATEE